MGTKFKVGAVLTGIGVLVGGVLLALSITVIGQGEGGVVYNRQHGVEDKPLSQGWQLVPFWEKVNKYPISTETVKVDKFKVQTKDGKQLTVSINYDYANELEKLPYIYDKFKGAKSKTIEEGWLQTRVKKATFNAFSDYTVLEVFQNQGKLNASIEENFRKSVEEHGFIIDSVTLGAPEPDKATAEAIQKVVNTQQEVEQLKLEEEKAVKQAEIDRTKAQGEADAKIIKAEGEAKANETIKKSLTDELVEYKSIEKWNGELPQVTGGSTPMVTIPGEKKEEK